MLRFWVNASLHKDGAGSGAMKPRAGTMGAAFTRRPRRRLRVATIGFQCVAVVGFVACAALLNYFRTEYDLPDEHELDGHAYARRALEGDSSSMTPKNAFSLQQMRHGAVLLNLLCLLYMAPSSFYPSPGARGVLWRTLLLALSVSSDAA